MKNSILALIFLICSISFSKAQQIVFVDPMASGDQSGNSWTNAYTNLTDAVNGSVAGSEIWVSNKAALLVTKAEVQTDKIVITKNLQIYGGFNGTETALDQRNVQTPTPSIISGAIGSNLTNTDNSHNAFLIQAEVVIDGFSFMFFNSDFEELPYYGVIVADTNSQLTIRNSAFSQNEGSYGGGLCISSFKNSLINAEQIAVFNNTSDGAIFTHSDNAVLNLKNSLIYNNGIPGGNAYLFYAGKNGNPSQQLNEQILLNVEGTVVSQNHLSMVFSYFGSNSFKDCEFQLEAAPQYTFNFIADSATCFIDNCSFTGTYETVFLYASGLKEFTFKNSSWNNSLGMYKYFFEVSGCPRISFINSDFNNLRGSIPFSANSSGTVTIKDCNFTDGEAGSYFLYINTKLFISEGNQFKRIHTALGNYFFCDSIAMRKCLFESITGTYSFTPFDNSRSVEVDSCEFAFLSHTYGLFRTGNVLVFKNSKVKSSSNASNNPGSMFLLANWGGKVTLINNRFEQIMGYGNLIANTGSMTVFGNTFEMISTPKPFFYNSKDLKLYNCNFVDMDMPLFHNDTSYNTTTPISFELSNSIIYSSNDTVIWNSVKPVNFSQAVSNCFTNNNNLTGSKITKDFTTSYEDLYAASSHPDLSDQGLDILADGIVPQKDINGDPRIMNGMIDIGAMEFQGLIASLINGSASDQILCYPNPARDFTNVKVASDCTLEVYALDGAKVMTSKLDQGLNKVSVTKLDSGLYIFYVRSNEDNYHFKFFKR